MTDEQASFEGVQDDVKKTVDSARSAVGKLKAEASRKVGDATEHARELLDQGQDRARQAYDELESYIKDQPVKSVAIALAVGLVLGLLMHASPSRRAAPPQAGRRRC